MLVGGYGTGVTARTACRGSGLWWHGGPRGVLLVHGFGGSPRDMELLGDLLAGRGYTVFAPELAGHGTDLARFGVVGWRDWVRSALEGVGVLAEACDQVVLAGFSLGAVISLFLAAGGEELPGPVRFQALLGETGTPAASTTSRPAAASQSRRRLWAPAMERVRGVVALGAPAFVSHRGPQGGILGQYLSFVREHPGTPLWPVAQLLAIIRQVRWSCGRLTLPVLLVQGGQDDVAGRSSARFYMQRLRSSPCTRMVLVQGAGHVIIEPPHLTTVWQAMEEFLQNLWGGGGRHGNIHGRDAGARDCHGDPRPGPR